MSANKNSAWVTAADVARHAGVSRSAVSRTFTEGASVSPDTRAKVLKSAETLGYQVNMLARSMIQRQSNLVGVVVSGFDNPFLQTLLGPLTHHLALRAQAPLLMDASEPEQLSKSLRHLLQYRIAGVILTSGTPPIALAREYLRLQIPVAMINREPSLEGVDVINSDNRHGAMEAARLMLASGSRRIVFLHSKTATHSGIARSAAFAKALAPQIKNKQITLSQCSAQGFGYSGGFEAARSLLADVRTRPDGVFCTNDALACGLIDGARELYGMGVPEDLRVIGFDDIPLASLAAYRLTTFRQDVNALAERAVACLDERMVDPDMPGRVLELPVSLMERSSCAPAGASADVPARRPPAKAAVRARKTPNTI